jgi:hypothetical protein
MDKSIVTKNLSEITKWKLKKLLEINCLLSKKYGIQFPSLKRFLLGYSHKCTPFFIENMWPNYLICRFGNNKMISALEHSFQCSIEPIR